MTPRPPPANPEARAIDALALHRDRQSFQRRAADDGWRDDLVFTTAAGSLLDSSRQRETFYATLKAASLPKIRLYDARHTAATLLLG